MPCPAPRAAPAEVAAWSAQLGLIIEPAGASWAGDAVHRVAAALRTDEAQAPFEKREISAVALSLLAGVDIAPVPAAIAPGAQQ